jgi:lycopene beta-cyclase
MIKSGKFSDKKILLVDREPKTKNDRTWCFWEKENGFFDKIVFKKWDKLSFLSDNYSNTMDISPYQYKMIRGIDFYKYCFDEISKQQNIEIFYGEVKLSGKQNEIFQLNGTPLPANDAIVFNSFHKSNDNTNKEISLVQHFKGWIIETSSPAFDHSMGTFMDFRVNQKRGTTFAYVLPFTETKALVEYTLFTEKILSDDEYENELNIYINQFLNFQEYKILEKEFGIIPMTTRPFQFYKDTIYNIGTAGGQTKASSGYTFQFIQKQSGMIVNYLVNNKPLSTLSSAPNRFLFYDKILLDVLYNKRASGKEIFTTLFKKNEPQQVLRFLDNESSIGEELKIISTLPTLPFLKAAINQF